MAKNDYNSTKRTTFLILFLFVLNIINSQNLFLIEDSKKYGYINNEGKEIIPVKYDYMGEFAEGLAVAKVNNLYGYVNKQGKFTIPLKYEWASSFSGGIALVKKGGYFRYVNKNDFFLFDSKFKAATPFVNNIAKVKKENSEDFYFIDNKGKAIHLPPWTFDAHRYEKYFIVITNKKSVGIFDINQRKMVLDTIYNDIEKIHNSIFKIEKRINNKTIVSLYNLNTGKIITSFDEHIGHISYVGNDLYSLSNFSEQKTNNEIIDTTGLTLFKAPLGSIVNFHFNNKVGIVSHIGIIDEDFKYVYKNKELLTYESINSKLGVINNSILVDANFQPIKNKVLEEINLGSFFEDCFIFSKNGKMGVMDYNFKVLIPNKYEQLIRYKDDLFFFSNTPDVDENYVVNKKTYGVINRSDQLIVKPHITWIDIENLKNDLIEIIMYDKKCCLNSSGSIVWMSSHKTSNISNGPKLHYSYEILLFNNDLDITNKSENGYFSSQKKIDDKLSKELKINKLNYVAKIDKNKIVLIIANATPKAIDFFNDSRRFMIDIEVLNEKGNWIPLTATRPSYCGSDYRVVQLNASHYWEFILENYFGEFKTKLRFCHFEYQKNKDKLDKKPIGYSNEIPIKIPFSFLY